MGRAAGDGGLPADGVSSDRGGKGGKARSRAICASPHRAGEVTTGHN